MGQKPYIHPSQGDAAKAYFESFKTDDDRCWTRAKLLGASAFALFAAAAEASPYSASLATGFFIGSLICGTRSVELMCKTDENYHAKQAYLEAGREHYRTFQEHAPAWLDAEHTEKL